MARRDSPGLTREEGRRFALTLSAAFTVLAAFFHWRDFGILLGITGGIAILLLFAGLAIPARLGPVERIWMGMAQRISRVMNPVVMGLIYYLVFTTVGLLRRRLKGNPLVRSQDAKGFWTSRATNRRPSNMERQF